MFVCVHVTEYCMGDGKALIILGVENEIDPLLDPVLEKQVTAPMSSEH